MAVEGDEPRAVVEVDAVAGEPEVVPREDDDTVGRRLDRRTLFCAHVDAAVAAAEFTVKVAALAVDGAEAAGNWAHERQLGRASRAVALHRGASEFCLARYTLRELFRRRDFRWGDGQFFHGVFTRRQLYQVFDLFSFSAGAE
ncbi:hypothetical protein SDC9_128254 [bioreactor metagenome]|uniref:Uncharacterized protein n=1 Tax=bioreactor metagenome TaxID=1076179 RepID=A0A645CWX5_9ZZZZ